MSESKELQKRRSEEEEDSEAGRKKKAKVETSETEKEKEPAEEEEEEEEEGGGDEDAALLEQLSKPYSPDGSSGQPLHDLVKQAASGRQERRKVHLQLMYFIQDLPGSAYNELASCGETLVQFSKGIFEFYRARDSCDDLETLHELLLAVIDAWSHIGELEKSKNDSSPFGGAPSCYLMERGCRELLPLMKEETVSSTPFDKEDDSDCLNMTVCYEHRFQLFQTIGCYERSVIESLGSSKAILHVLPFVVENIVKPKWYCKEAALYFLAFLMKIPTVHLSTLFDSLLTVLAEILVPPQEGTPHHKVQEAAAFAVYALFTQTEHHDRFHVDTTVTMFKALLSCLEKAPSDSNNPDYDLELQVMRALNSLLTVCRNSRHIVKYSSYESYVKPLFTILLPLCFLDASDERKSCACSLFCTVLECSPSCVRVALWENGFHAVFDNFKEGVHEGNQNNISVLVDIFDAYFLYTAEGVDVISYATPFLDEILNILTKPSSSRNFNEDELFGKLVEIFSLVVCYLKDDTERRVHLKAVMPFILSSLGRRESSQRAAVKSLTNLFIGNKMKKEEILPYCEEVMGAFSTVLKPEVIFFEENDTQTVEDIFGLLSDIALKLGDDFIPYATDVLSTVCALLENESCWAETNSKKAILDTFSSIFQVLFVF